MESVALGCLPFPICQMHYYQLLGQDLPKIISTDTRTVHHSLCPITLVLLTAGQS